MIRSEHLQRRNGYSRRKGLTSLDLLVSLPSTAIIIAGLGTCVTLMLRANQQDEQFYKNIQQISDASLQMAMELELANGIATSSATAIEFCVPDRNGDSLPEQIRYEWKTNSTSNQRDLFRQINQGPEAPVISNLRGFELQYSYASASTIPNRFRSESVLLKKVDSVPSVSYSEQVLTSTNHVCIIFRPDQSTTFTTWDLGSLEFMLRTGDPDAAGSLQLRIVAVANGLPNPSVVYADIQLLNQDLSSKYQYVEFPIAPVDLIPSSTTLAVVLSTSTVNPPIFVQCLSHGRNLPADLQMLTTRDSGGSWRTQSNTSPRFLATGFTSSSSSSASARRNLTNVDIFMTGLPGMNPTMMASAKLLAQPEVP